MNLKFLKACCEVSSEIKKTEINLDDIFKRTRKDEVVFARNLYILFHKQVQNNSQISRDLQNAISRTVCSTIEDRIFNSNDKRKIKKYKEAIEILTPFWEIVKDYNNVDLTDQDKKVRETLNENFKTPLLKRVRNINFLFNFFQKENQWVALKIQKELDLLINDINMGINRVKKDIIK